MSSSNGPKSPNTEVEEREELESIIKDLEEENASLQAEYDRLKNKQTPTSTPDDAQTTPTQGGTGQGQVTDELCLERSLLQFPIVGHDGRSEAFKAAQGPSRGAHANPRGSQSSTRSAASAA